MHYLSDISRVTCSCSVSFHWAPPCQKCEGIKRSSFSTHKSGNQTKINSRRVTRQEEVSANKKCYWFISTKGACALVLFFKKGNIQLRERTARMKNIWVCLRFYWIHGSWYYCTVWRLGYQQSLHYRKVLRHCAIWKTMGLLVPSQCAHSDRK